MTLYLNDTLHSRAVQFITHFVNKYENPAELKTSKEVLEDCTLPAFIDDNHLVVSGLCHVVRQVVKFSINNVNNERARKNYESLLGYKQNCLKACSVVSNWTKFCEVDLPSAINKLNQYMKQTQSDIFLPEELIKLENEFTVSKKTPNALKYFKGKKKDTLKTRDNVDLSKVPCSSFQTFWCKCGFTQENNINKVRKIENGIKITTKDWCKEDITSVKDIVWPFLCGFTITIADLLVISCFMELMWKVPSFITHQNLFEKLPKTKQWLLRCFGIKELFDAVREVWTCEEEIVNLQKSFQYPSDTNNITHVSHEEKTFNPKQIHVKITKSLPGIIETLSQNQITRGSARQTNEKTTIVWEEFPNGVDPSGGELKPKRALRKRQQIENMASRILPLLNDGDRVVEFCAGGGHLGIVLAYLKPNCQLILVDNKEESIDRAITRINSLNLQNVTLHLSNLEYFTGSFNVGVTLHACGTATDLVLKKCITNRASFVICPCCYGSIRSTTDVSYPKSSKFICCLGSADFHILAHSADQTNSNYTSDYSKQGKTSMLLVDTDRALHAKEIGNYNEVTVFTMTPEECSPKNHMIVGVA